MILLLTGLPGQYIPHVTRWVELFQPDKILHLVIFIIFVMMWGSVLSVQKPGLSSPKIFSLVLLAGVIFGTSTELLQKWVFITRYASWADWVADMAGCLGGIGLLKFLQNRGVVIPYLTLSHSYGKEEDTTG